MNGLRQIFQRPLHGGQPRTNTEPAFAVGRTIHGQLEIAILGTLAACFLYFIVMVVPNLAAAGTRAERVRTQEIATQDEWYCRDLRIAPGTAMGDRCMADLQALRTNVEQQLADEVDF